MILFLDFDGVLHPDEAYLVHAGQSFVPKPKANYSCGHRS